MEKGAVIGVSCAGGVALLIILLAFVGYKFLRNRRDKNAIDSGRRLSNTVTSDTDVRVDLDHYDGVAQGGHSETFTPNSKPHPADSAQVVIIGRNNSSTSTTVLRLELEENRNSSDPLQASHYDYPSQVETSVIANSKFQVENIYENIQPRNSVQQRSGESIIASTSLTATTQMKPYNSVLFQNRTDIEPSVKSVQTTNFISSPKSVDRRLSPPISEASGSRNLKAHSLANPRRCLFPYKTLVIAADATPRDIGAYLINHFSKRVEFYSVPSSRMPWILRNRTRSGNPTEFEMKNLLIALLLWEDNIIRHRKVAIFTDNSAVIGKNSMYGGRVRSFIQHLEKCHSVLHVNPNWTFVNSKESPNIFQEFIIPADQLSRQNETGFRNSVMAYHYELHEGQISHMKFNAIRHKILYWVRNRCVGCGFQIPKSGSLKKWIN